jgi:outer membrane protein assembly factor BamB
MTGCSGVPKTCSPLWTGPGGGYSSPTVQGDVLYVASDKLYAIDAEGRTNCSGSPKTCSPLWTAATGVGFPSSPTVAHGVVYVTGSTGFSNGAVDAFDAVGVRSCSGTPKTCQPLWTASLGHIDGTPAIANGVLYVGSTDNKLYAFDGRGVRNCSGTPKACTPLWTAATGGPISASPAVAYNTVYIGSTDLKLYAYDARGITNCSSTPKTCSPLWTAPTTGSIQTSSAAIANGVVFVGSNDFKLYAFDARGIASCSGTPRRCSPLWTATTGGEIFSSPAIANGVVYIGTAEDHRLYAYHLP